eukprot:7885487-Pyramimonas_sp.AAC.4
MARARHENMEECEDWEAGEWRRVRIRTWGRERIKRWTGMSWRRQSVYPCDCDGTHGPWASGGGVLSVAESPTVMAPGNAASCSNRFASSTKKASLPGLGALAAAALACAPTEVLSSPLTGQTAGSCPCPRSAAGCAARSCSCSATGCRSGCAAGRA